MKIAKDRKLFFGLLGLLFLAIFARYTLQVDFPREIFIGIAALIFLLGDRNEMIALCVALIPVYTSVPFFTLIAVCVVFYVVKFADNIKINVTVFPVVLLIMWELIHGFSAEEYSLPYVLVQFVPMILLAVLMCSNYEKWDYEFIVRTMAIATLFACVVLLGRVLIASNMNFGDAFVNMQRLGLNSETMDESLTVTDGEINPNSLGIICVLAVSGLLQMLSSGRGRRLDVVLVISLLILGMLTMSRTYLACLLLMVFLFVVAQRGRLRTKLQFVIGIVACVVVVCVVVVVAFPYVVETFVQRFQTTDLTSGRMDLMAKYNEFLAESAKNLFFGVGLYDMGEKLTVQYAVANNVPHNGIQEVIVAWGIPGLLLFVAFLGCMIWRSREIISKQLLLNYIPLIIILFKVQVGQMVSSSYTMVSFGLAYLSLCHDFYRIDEEIPEETSRIKIKRRNAH